MEKQNKSTGKTALIAVLLLVAVAAIIFATYAWAKYTETIDGSATAQVAKWNVNAQFDKSKFVNTYTHVLADRIAPGTDGTMDVTLTVTETEVDVDYQVSIKDIKITDINTNKTYALVADAGKGIEEKTSTELLAMIPENIKFVNAGDQSIAINDLIGAKLASGRIKAKAEKAENVVTIEDILKWNWAFETGSSDIEKAANNEKDTEAGKNPVKIAIEYKVEMVQVEPAATGSTSAFSFVTPIPADGPNSTL